MMTDAISATAPEAAVDNTDTRGAPRHRKPQGNRNARPAQPPRKVHPALEKLFALYPAMFGTHFMPLKLGVYQDLLAQHPDDFDKADLKVALGLHARSTRYLESVAAGHPRCDLQGNPVEATAPEHVHHAILEIFKRRQSRSREDLRPYASAQLVRAITASGLSREDYELRMRGNDESYAALLDEAFAELARQTAKADALVKTFEASGRTVAEFADMYGLNADDVTAALATQRPATAT